MKITFTPLTEGAKFTPPQPIKMNLPSWYKDVPPIVEGRQNAIFPKAGNFTIKKCLPIFNEVHN